MAKAYGTKVSLAELLEKLTIRSSIISDEIKITRPATPPFTETKIRYALCMDIETTSENSQFYIGTHEIIDLPVILVDLEDGKIIDEFHTYVRPTKARKLSKFCLNLSNITQSMVDCAPSFPEAMKMLEEFLEHHSDKLTPHPLKEKRCIPYCLIKHSQHVTEGPWEKSLLRNYIWVTHGRADFERFFCTKSCQINDLQLPPYMCGGYVDIQYLFEEAFNVFVSPMSISFMLNYLNMKFEGQEHDGLDDAKMISKILLKINEKIDIHPNAYINMPTSHRYTRHIFEDTHNYLKSKNKLKYNNRFLY